MCFCLINFMFICKTSNGNVIISLKIYIQEITKSNWHLPITYKVRKLGMGGGGSKCKRKRNNTKDQAQINGDDMQSNF